MMNKNIYKSHHRILVMNSNLLRKMSNRSLYISVNIFLSIETYRHIGETRSFSALKGFTLRGSHVFVPIAFASPPKKIS